MNTNNPKRLAKSYLAGLQLLHGASEVILSVTPLLALAAFDMRSSKIDIQHRLRTVRRLSAAGLATVLVFWKYV